MPEILEETSAQPSTETGAQTAWLVIDTHVHIHACFPLASFLDAAVHNAQTEAAHHNRSARVQGVLLLTETCRDQWFQQLVSYADTRQSVRNDWGSQWRFYRTDDDAAIRAQSAKGAALFIMAGRQIVTKDKLEVLALITEQRFEDGGSTQDTIARVRQQGGIPVIPWGFGKWWGRRGQILSELLPAQAGTLFFLGDNSGRPKFLPHPPHFAQAKNIGIRILPGSDPLPFASEFWRPCSVGISLAGTINPATPATDLKRLLCEPGVQYSAFMRLETWHRFLRNQVAMQLVKHRA